MEQSLAGRQFTCASIIRRSCFARWLNKATDTHSHYVTLNDFRCLQILRERKTTLQNTNYFHNCNLVTKTPLPAALVNS